MVYFTEDSRSKLRDANPQAQDSRKGPWFISMLLGGVSEIPVDGVFCPWFLSWRSTPIYEARWVSPVILSSELASLPFLMRREVGTYCPPLPPPNLGFEAN